MCDNDERHVRKKSTHTRCKFTKIDPCKEDDHVVLHVLPSFVYVHIYIYIYIHIYTRTYE